MMNPITSNAPASLDGRIDLFPSPSCPRLTDNDQREAQLFGKFFRGFIGKTDESNQFFRQDRFGVSLSEVVTSLRDAILRIFLRGPEFQMAWIDAGSYIAGMKNNLPFWHRAIGQDPSYAVRPLGYLAAEFPVSAVVGEGKPHPTLVRGTDSDLAPEAFGDKLGFSHEHLLCACDRDRCGLDAVAVPFILAEAA